MVAKSSVRVTGDWMFDPEQMQRLDALAAVTQRTAFVKAIMGLSDPEHVICAAIQRSCLRQDIEVRIPRGKPALSLNFKELSVERRYGGSLLLKALYNSDDGGLDSGTDGSLVGNELLDRMLYVYQRYLATTSVTAHEAPVSFEMFALMRQMYALAEIEFVACENCGGEYISGRANQGIRCPLCAAHRHAVRVKNIAPVRHFDQGDILKFG